MSSFGWREKEEKDAQKRPVCPHCCVEMEPTFRGRDMPQLFFKCLRWQDLIIRKSPWREKDILFAISNELQLIRIHVQENIKRDQSLQKDASVPEATRAPEEMQSGP